MVLTMLLSGTERILALELDVCGRASYEDAPFARSGVPRLQKERQSVGYCSLQKEVDAQCACVGNEWRRAGIDQMKMQQLSRAVACMLHVDHPRYLLIGIRDTNFFQNAEPNRLLRHLWPSYRWNTE